MASRENSTNGSQAASSLIVNDETKSLPWDEPPLSLLSSEQQVQFKNQAYTCHYKLGKKFGLQIAQITSFLLFLVKSV